MSIQVSTRIDEVTKRQFDRVCERIGISPSGALSIFIKGVINFNGIPFNVVAPHETNQNIVGSIDTLLDGVLPKDPSKRTLTLEESFGCMRGQFAMSEDFDEAIDDFKEYM